MRKIYLDYAAATPIDPIVLAAMEPYFSKQFYNPSALYLDAKKIAHDIDSARSQVASWLGARNGEIIFTAGGTEANNLAIHGVMQAFPKANVLVSQVEHESVLHPAQTHNCQEIAVNQEGIVRLAELGKQINGQTVLISVMYANNEIGTIEPLAKIAALIKQVRKRRLQTGNKLPLYLHTDACQAAAYLDLHTTRLGVDLMTLNGGKIYGSKQSGALYIRAGTNLVPQIHGGGQEQNKRSGTENVAAIMGFATALDLVQQRRHQESQRLQALQRLFFQLIAQKLPRAELNGPLKHRLPNNVHLTIDGTDNERLVMAMDEAGIQCAAGSACSASSEESSHVLKAIGLSDKLARSSLRISMGRMTTEKDVQHTVETLVKLVA